MVPTASPVGLSGTASRAGASAFAASALFVAATSALAVSVVALFAATEFIVAVANTAMPSKLAARKIARVRSAIFRFALPSLMSDSNEFAFLRFDRRF